MARPGDALLHPIALAALIVLVVNDHILKATWPGFVTGKLSDVAGLIIAPLVLEAAWELGAWVSGRWNGPSARVLAVAIVLVGGGFALSQVWPPAVEAYRIGLGVLQAPFRAIVAALTGGSVPDIAVVRAVGDAEDLLALPTLALTWCVGRRRGRAVG